MVYLGKTKLETLRDSSQNRKTDISECICAQAWNKQICTPAHMAKSSWWWHLSYSHHPLEALLNELVLGQQAELCFLIMLHIIGFLQNIFLEDAPNLFRNITDSFLSEHITMKKERDGTHGYIIYVTTSEYKWKFWLKKLSLGQIVNNKANYTNTLHL